MYFNRKDFPLYSISHTTNAVGVIVSYGKEVGLDVEDLRSDISDIESISANCFTGDEHDYVRFGADAAEHAKRFFTIRTRKEAYFKMKGEGLTCNKMKSISTINHDFCIWTIEMGSHLYSVCGVPEEDTVIYKLDSGDLLRLYRDLKAWKNRKAIE